MLPAIGMAGEKSALTVKDALSEQMLIQEEINSDTALIKSKSDLARYNAALAASPLGKAPAFARNKFLNSLIFTENGLASYSYTSLRDFLSLTEIYQVLALFGAQQSTGIIPGIKPRTSQERLIQTIAAGGGGGDKTDRICSDNGLGDGYKCSYSFGDVCRSTCGVKK